MNNNIIPRCVFCDAEQEFDIYRMSGVYCIAVVCTSGGCGSNGPWREAETEERAKKLAIEAYKQATDEKNGELK